MIAIKDMETPKNCSNCPFKAIPLDKLHEMCDEIKCLDGYDTTYKYVKIDKVIKIINKYIESEG